MAGPKGFSNPACEVDLRPGDAYRIVIRSPPTEWNIHSVAFTSRLCRTRVSPIAARSILQSGTDN